MTRAWTVFKATVVGCAVTTVISSSIQVPCPAGTRVYSLAVWSGYWLDGLVMSCTGDSDVMYVPPEFEADPDGEEDAGICAGTAGVQSMHWNLPDSAYGLVYLNITCLDESPQLFADGYAYEAWNITGNRTISCDEGEYVRGLTYSLDYAAENSTHSYFLTDLDFMCSSSTLDPICTDCSGATSLKSDEDQPEYCELQSCSEMECCESNADEEAGTAGEEAESDGKEAQSIAETVVIGVVSTVAAAMVISGCSWVFHKLNNERFNGRGVEGFRTREAPRVCVEDPAQSP